MSEPERTTEKQKEKINKLEQKVESLERSMRALLEAFKQLEEEQDECYMPEGEYHGVKFDV